MTEIKVYSFWFTCQNCKKETSVSCSTSLAYDDLVSCILCNTVHKVTGFKHEPEIRVEKS
jgi:transcription elongation factor Elf1